MENSSFDVSQYMIKKKGFDFYFFFETENIIHDGWVQGAQKQPQTSQKAAKKTYKPGVVNMRKTRYPPQNTQTP